MKNRLISIHIAPYKSYTRLKYRANSGFKEIIFLIYIAIYRRTRYDLKR